MHIRTLTTADFPQLYKCFLGAFSGYAVAMQPSQDELLQRLRRISFSYALSAGAFEGEEMQGFIMTGAMAGKPLAYNGGTGVLPQARGKGLGKKLYEFLFPIYKAQKFDACVLEVIDSNAPAIALYKGLGFAQTRLLRCFVQQAELPRFVNDSIHIALQPLPQWHEYLALSPFLPSWQNMGAAVQQSHDVVAEAYWGGQLSGYISFSPADGRISQIAVAPSFRRKGVGTLLLHFAQHYAHRKLSAINIDDAEAGACQFLLNRGFMNTVNQLEMRKAL
jgi:ribosomal protein S18 acetylase RimI-like enzyme